MFRDIMVKYFILYKMILLSLKSENIFKKNSELRNKHKGERCFILATGPSIKEQDLTPLQYEHCIAITSFYLHKDYKKINPEYHLFSGIFPHRYKITPELGIEFFQEMSRYITANQKLLLNFLDYDLIENSGILKEYDVNYLAYQHRVYEIEKVGIDLCKGLCRSINSSNLAIQIAIGMGFSEIYLLGMDHDWILNIINNKFKHNHFFEREESVFDTKAHSIPEDDLGKEFKKCAQLWEEYEDVNKYTKKRGIKIYNATGGGILDVFPKVDFNSLFNKTSNEALN